MSSGGRALVPAGPCLFTSVWDSGPDMYNMYYNSPVYTQLRTPMEKLLIF